jgi:hypothetical protein
MKGPIRKTQNAMQDYLFQEDERGEVVGESTCLTVSDRLLAEWGLGVS